MSKIILEREKCIGCGSCEAVCPLYFELIADGKAHIKGAEPENEQKTEELEVKKIDCATSAAEACPVQCIHIEK